MANEATNNDIPPQTVWIAKEAHARGPNDPDISRPWLLAKNITKYLDTDADTKDELNFLADRLLDKLESALMYYQLIVDDDFEDRNVSQKRTIYEGLYATLWSFYKGRTQNYVGKMGWDLEVFFCKEENFDKVAKKFSEHNPEHIALIDLARGQRAGWQTDFGMSRNISEHTGDYRDGTSSYETKDDAKRLFAQVCWTAELLIAYCGSYTMSKGWNVTELNSHSTVFDRDARYIVEHAIQTAHREN